MLWLKVDLLSGVLVGSGVAAPGVADRDVVTGPTGLPYIPGKRLKGLWSDAYELLHGLKGAEELGLPAFVKMFPKGGAEQSGPLYVRTAQLAGAAQLDGWLSAVLRSQKDRHEENLQPEEVTALYTELRHQTAIDPKTGAAKEETLRTSRVLRSGLCFFAPVQLREGAPAGALRALALSAAAIQRMGTSRSRGLGKVACALLEGEAPSDPKGVDLTALALADSEWKDAPAAVATTFPERTDTSDTPCVLRYRLHLRQPALVPRMSGDPNLVATERHLPGTAVLGALARRYLVWRQPDARFYELFCGPVKFLSAYPAAGAEGRCVPVPHSLRKYKNGDGYVDLAVETPNTDEPFKRVKGAWCEAPLLWSRESRKIETETRFDYHQARARDRRIQRAVKPEEAAAYQELEKSERGAFFSYESIAPDQYFAGALIGAERDLRQLRALIADNDEVNVGRSRAAQYGGAAEWRWVDDAPQPLDQCGEEASNWAGTPAGCGDGNRLVVTLLSPMLSTNENGHPETAFPADELAASMGWPKGSISDPDRASTRQDWVAGYLAHQGLPRQQVPVLEAGSVFVFKLPKGCSPVEEARRAAAARSYGLRTEQGFGRISLEWWTHENSRRIDRGEIFAEALPSTLEPLAVDSPARALALKMLRQRVRELAITRGSGLKGQVKMQHPEAAPIKSSLLHRLLAWLDGGDPTFFAEQVGSLRETASAQLNRARIQPRGGKLQKFGDWLESMGAGWRSVYNDLANATYLGHTAWGVSLGGNPLRLPPPADSKVVEPADAAFARSVVCSLLRSCLAAMAMERREIR